MRTIILVIVVFCLIGCAKLDPMEIWAKDHAHEVCVTFPGTAKGILIPLSDLFQAQKEGAIVQPISFCNPHE